MNAPNEPSAAAVDHELQGALNDAMGRLPAPDRDVVVRRYLEGQSSAEVAAALKLTEENTRMRLSRAIERLRKILGRKGTLLAAGVLIAGIERAASRSASAAILTRIESVVIYGTAPSATAQTLAQGALRMILYTQFKAAAFAGSIAAAVAVALTLPMAMAQTPPANAASPTSVPIVAAAATTAPGASTIMPSTAPSLMSKATVMAGLSVVVEPVKASFDVSETLAFKITYRNITKETFRLPQEVNPPSGLYEWHLILQEVNSGKAYTGAFTMPVGITFLGKPLALPPDFPTVSTVQLQGFSYADGELSYTDARNAALREGTRVAAGRNGQMAALPPLEPGTYDVRLFIAFPAPPRARAGTPEPVDNDPTPLWNSGSGTIKTEPARITVTGVGKKRAPFGVEAARAALDLAKRHTTSASANNHGGFVEKARADVARAAEDFAAAVDFLAKHPEIESQLSKVSSESAETVARVRAMKLDTPNNQNSMVDALKAMQSFLVALEAIPGGNLDGNRDKVIADIDAAARNVFEGFNYLQGVQRKPRAEMPAPRGGNLP